MSLELDLCDANGALSVIAVIQQMWHSRENTAKLCKLCDILCECADESDACAEMEMYLPQLAHFSLILGRSGSKGKTVRNELVDTATERVLLVLAQISAHAAFRICFMVSAALEDYQPELPDGTENPIKDDFLYYRCARILQNIERSVAYGSPILLANDEKSIKSTHGVNVMVESTDRERRSRMKRIMESNADTALTTGEDKGAPLSRLHSIDDELKEGCRGFLMFKRASRKHFYSGHKWKWRYFRIEQGVLFCSRSADWSTARGGIMRAMPLEGSALVYGDEAIAKGDTKHPFCVLVKNFSTGFEFHLRAETEEVFAMWKNALEKECYKDHSFPYPLPSTTGADGTAKTTASNTTTNLRTLALRRKRWLAFSQQRKFISDITDICERLRFIDRPLRHAFMVRDIKRLKIPPFGYIPLVNSNDPFSYILRAVPAKAHAFRTKARCPILMYFETESHPKETDVATFFSSELHEYSETEILLGVKDIVLTDKEATDKLGDDDDDDDDDDEEYQGEVEHAPSRFNIDLHPTGPWREAGSGLQRVEGAILKQELVLSPRLSAAESAEAKSHDRRASSSHLNVTEETKLRASSPFSHLSNWGLEGFIAKSNDDLRQEMFVMQMITYMRGLFEAESEKLWIKSYQVMNTSQRTGMIQLIKRCSSLDAIKKSEDWPGSLRALFLQRHGTTADKTAEASAAGLKAGSESPALKVAILNFVYSMAASSIVCYLLAIKDRHNGNVMMDEDGHVVHIDFGFVFGLAPGKAFSMETSPFKLTVEMVDVMGGKESPHYDLYKKLCADAYVVAASHSDQLCTLVEMMSEQSAFPCFSYNGNAAAEFRSRLCKMEGKTRFEVDKFIESLVKSSYGHSGTMMYDDFQVATNGIKK